VFAVPRRHEDGCRVSPKNDHGGIQDEEASKKVEDPSLLEMKPGQRTNTNTRTHPPPAAAMSSSSSSSSSSLLLPGGVAAASKRKKKRTGYAGNTCAVRSLEECRRGYDQVVKTGKYATALSPQQIKTALLDAPTAYQYVSKLLQEVAADEQHNDRTENGIDGGDDDDDSNVEVKKQARSSNASTTPAKSSTDRYKGQVSVVTGVYPNSVGYHVACELALCSGLLGLRAIFLVGKNQKNLDKSIRAIRQEAVKRNIPLSGKLNFHAQVMNVSSLKSVRTAACAINRLVELHYSNATSKSKPKIAILVHAASTGSSQPRLTQDDIEYNVGCNFIAPHYLTTLLLPNMMGSKQRDGEGKTFATTTTTASTSAPASSLPSSKSRVVFTSSIGHCLGGKFSPHRFARCPQEGGAPSGYLTYDSDTRTLREFEPPPPLEPETVPGVASRIAPKFAKYWDHVLGTAASAATAPSDDDEKKPEQPPTPPLPPADLATVGTQVGRSKMAMTADCAHFARLFGNDVVFASVHPGSIQQQHQSQFKQPPTSSSTATTSSSTSTSSIFANVVDNYTVRFTPSQAARPYLRAALDPDFDALADDEDYDQHRNNGWYLHCDGNPWPVALPIVSKDPETNEPYQWDAFCHYCYEAAEYVVALKMRNIGNNDSNTPKLTAYTAVPLDNGLANTAATTSLSSNKARLPRRSAETDDGLTASSDRTADTDASMDEEEDDEAVEGDGEKKRPANNNRRGSENEANRPGTFIASSSTVSAATGTNNGSGDAVAVSSSSSSRAELEEAFASSLKRIFRWESSNNTYEEDKRISK